MFKISKFILNDLLRSKVILVYTAFLIAVGWGVFFMESHPEKAQITLMQLSLIVIPIFTMVFTAIYYYNSLEFTNLLLAQPVKRNNIINGQFFSLSIAYAIAYLLGLAVPLLLHKTDPSAVLLIVCGILLSVIFTGITLLIAVYFKDKSRGMGIVILLWAFLAFIFDALLLLFMYQFGEYPIEKLMMILSLLNPIDTARIIIIMQTDVSAMMGLSAAVFKKLFGSNLGITISLANLLLWTWVPFLLTKRKFRKKDF